MADGGQVDADLVRAPGVDADAQQRRAVERLRDRVATSAPPARAARAADIFLRCTGSRPMGASMVPWRGRGHAEHDGQVLLLHRARRELARPAPRWVSSSLATTMQAGGAAVQPVDDARPQHAADAGEVADVVEERVHQRARRRARARDGPPGRPACPRPAGGRPRGRRARGMSSGRGHGRPRLRHRDRRPPGRPRTRADGRAGAPSTVTAPSAIRAWRRARLRSGSCARQPAVEPLARAPPPRRRRVRAPRPSRPLGGRRRDHAVLLGQA